MDNPLSRRATISRPAFSRESLSPQQLDGVMINFQIACQLKLVTIADLALPQLPSQEKFNYNFALEKRILEECKVTYRQVAAAGEPRPQNMADTAPQATSRSSIPAATSMLLPTVVGGDLVSGGVVSSAGMVPKEISLNLMDFEAANDPFEMLTLKALNDRAELESIWTHSQTTGTTPTSAVMTTTTSAVPSSQPVAEAVHNVVAPPPGPSLSSPPPGPAPSTPPPSQPQVALPVPKPRRFQTRSVDGLSSSPVPGLVSTPSPVTPSAVTSSPPLVTPSNPDVGPPYPVPVLPEVPPPYSQGRPALQDQLPGPGKPPPYSSPPVGNRSRVGGVRVLPVPGGAVARPSLPPRPSPPVPPKPRPQVVRYKLEDPRQRLSDEDLSRVLQIASMGFDQICTARAFLRLGRDQAKVLDFLFLVGQLEELGYHGNSAETALIACDNKIEEATDYLKNVARFTEMGYGEKSVHDAFQSGGQDWDKALDALLEK